MTKHFFWLLLTFQQDRAILLNMKRRTKFEQRDLLYKVAELFYVQKLHKSDIADRLHMSPTHVARLIEQAKKEGIVQIEIKLVGHLEQLESNLKEMYGLREVRLVKKLPEYRELQKALGHVAAEILEKKVSREARTSIGIGGGLTNYSIVESLEERPRPVDVYPMSLFGRGPEVEYVDSIFLAMLLFMKCRPLSKGFIVGVPPLPSNPTIASEFASMLIREIPEVKTVMEGAKSVDLAFIGAGSFISARDIFVEYAKLGYTYESMQAAGVIGGVNYNYFDIKGVQVGSGILTVSIEDLKTMSADPAKTVVLVAGGGNKGTAIKVALQTKMANTLVTDEETADFLLAP